jgi:hypothetical protein
MRISDTNYCADLPTFREGEKVKLVYSDKTHTIGAYVVDRLGNSVPIKGENTPKEFKKINNPQMFSAIFRDAYVKIQIMNDGEPHLYVNQRVRGGGGGNTSRLDDNQGIDLAEVVLSLVEVGQEELQTREIKDDAIILAGRTGAGKSTLGNLIMGVHGESASDRQGYKIGFKKPIFSVGDSITDSCTRCPNTHCPDNMEHTYIDYPGFDDTDGLVIDTTNAFFRKEVLSKVKRFKIVLVVDYTDLAKRGTYFSETLKNLTNLFLPNDKDLDRLASSICLVVNHFPSTTNAKEDSETIYGILVEHYQKLQNVNHQSLLGAIIRNERWQFLSTPNSHVGHQHQVETRNIKKVIEATEHFIKYDNEEIQVVVNEKHLGKIQDAIMDIVEDLNRNFSGKIFQEVTARLQKFYNEASSKKAVQDYQQGYQHLIQSKEQRSLAQLLNLFGLSNKIVTEAAYYDKHLKFLIDLLPKDCKTNFPYTRDWIDQLHLRTSLERWNQYLLDVTTDAQVKYNAGEITLQQYFPRISQIRTILHQYKDIKRIVVHGLHSVIFDSDLDLSDLGVNVAIMAPYWEIKNKKDIKLTGKNSSKTFFKAARGALRGILGDNGEAGEPGTNGGDFFGFGKKFSYKKEVTTPLTITSKGGNGSAGQEGGDGQEGTDGPAADVKNDFVKNVEGMKSPGTVISVGWDDVGVLVDHGNDTYDRTLRNWGKPGGLGGAGGMGGAGGKGGIKGTLELIFLDNITHPFQLITANGDAGAHGRSGEPGEGGMSGMAWGGIWHAGGNPDCDWNTWHKAAPHDERRVRSKPGIKPGNDDTDPNKLPRDPDKKDPMNVHQLMYDYRKFAIQGGNLLTAPTLEQFRKDYDSHSEMQKKESVDAFIEECQWMENFYMEIEEKSKCLPLYEAMLERIRTFTTLKSTSHEINLLQCLYSLTLSKICQMNALKESRLIMDIHGFLKIIHNNIKSLDKIDHNVQVRIHEEQYDLKIQSKIDEAGIFIKKLQEDIREADREIDKQIDILVQEIKTIKTQNQAKKSELKSKEHELEEAISKKKLFGALILAVQCIGCCFGPTGALVAGVVSAGLTIASNPSSAPTVAAHLISSYLPAIDGVLNNTSLALHAAHQNSLTRIRTLTVASAAYDVVNSPSNTDEERLKNIRNAIGEIDKQQSQLDQFEKKVKDSYAKSLHQVVDQAVLVQEQLKGQSIINLDFSRLSIRRAFANIKSQVKACTMGFSSGDGFLNIVKQLEDALDTTADIHERVQEYEERRELVRYMANLAATRLQDSRIDKYEQKVWRNVILEQYSRAVAAVHQWAFPVGSKFLGDFAKLDSFLKAVNIEDLIKQIIKELKLLQIKVGADQVQVDSCIDSKLWRGEFSSGNTNGPFYAWKFADHRRQMTRLLQGKEAIFFADVTWIQKLKQMCAVKYTDIRLKIKSYDGVLEKKLEGMLKGTRVSMHHSGISYYAYEGKVYQISNDQGFHIAYQYGENDANAVLSKIRAGNAMLSPYTHWAISLDLGDKDLYGMLSEWFFYKDLKIELQLEGSGQYILK